MRIREPDRAIAWRYHPLRTRLPIHSAARVLDIDPADLVGETDQIVPRGIQQLEGIAAAIVRIPVAGGVVVLDRQARRSGDTGERVSQQPSAAPRVHAVGGQVPAFENQAGVVLECADLAQPARPAHFHVEVAGGSRFGLIVRL